VDAQRPGLAWKGTPGSRAVTPAARRVRQAFIADPESRAVPDQSALHTMVFNSLQEQIAVIDRAGTIVEVNSAWESFGAENGLPPDYACVGCNYLEVLSASAASGDGSAGDAARAIMDVISGKRASVYMEYPCHGPDEKRWFMMRVTSVKGDSTDLVVISHQNITLRKLAEERAERLAMQDPLTGLANRRCFNQILSSEMRRCIRNRSIISLVEIDVDYFKEYNDELGHLAGDQCLADVGRALLAYARRPGDLAVRLGGDEFALLLGDADAAESSRIAEAIRKAIEDLGMVFGGSRQVTVSVGVATVIPDRQQCEDFLLREADRALYGAKGAGRNRVVHASLPGTS
jgi:diguanylate cyclase (GGDEF)-like protein